MTNTTKWFLLGATLVSMAVVFVSAVIPVAYEQALVNLLVGELAALTLAHSTYRVSSGKQASPLAAAIAVLSGIVLFLSPVLIEPVDPILSVMFAAGAVVTVGGLVGVLGRVLGSEESRQTGAERISRNAGN
ncbi:hypothetical protein BDK61_3399 [Haloarcula quadrata]|uniref:Uncharacterized protein n=2 Tax=Haloarcula TaxID=2237 RepID=M0JWV3_9EURY|nr:MULTISPECIES: hypothetical protein [Haloarcula]EMA12883.1 hypothetical protein C436_14060 [Haloarcula sinaiiensis ATCC 33800]NHN63737.1 hypothetical protein [Haloarcula sp. JP-Z28]QUJ71193.1 hypothetical protein KDQ40_10725 [Haloarcula sinaiiensis ATCC 33800]RKS84001.1 hypothetical protein BDK61_3399 [Haloarcula quadrata]